MTSNTRLGGMQVKLERILSRKRKSVKKRGGGRSEVVQSDLGDDEIE